MACFYALVDPIYRYQDPIYRQDNVKIDMFYSGMKNMPYSYAFKKF